MIETTTLVRELAGAVCRCGRVKRHRQTFCTRCFQALPPALKRALYCRIGEGYEEAYDAAVAALAARS